MHPRIWSLSKLLLVIMLHSLITHLTLVILLHSLITLLMLVVMFNSMIMLYQLKIILIRKEVMVFPKLNLVEMVQFQVMCPTELKKTYLSNQWANIMKDVVGTHFRGGVVEFGKELIKYTTQKSFEFKYVRNEKRYIHVVCQESHCDWFIKANRHLVNNYFVISKANINHKCNCNLVMEHTSRLVPIIIGELVLQNVKAFQMSNGKDMIRVMKDNYEIDIDYWKAY
ncbi:hypothetical protein ACS0TY_024830 [Phlomoides rotata]